MLPPGLSHLTIRPATNNDLEAIVKLVFGVLREFGLEPDPSATDADLQDIEANYLQRGGLFEVIEDRRWQSRGQCRDLPNRREHLRASQDVLRSRQFVVWVWEVTCSSAPSIRRKSWVLDEWCWRHPANWRPPTGFTSASVFSHSLPITWLERADQSYSHRPYESRFDSRLTIS